MFKHLRRSLAVFRRRPCSLDLAKEQLALAEARQAYELQISRYKTQLNAFQLQQRDSAESSQSVAALKAMILVLREMVENRGLKVIRYGTHEMVNEDGTVQ